MKENCVEFSDISTLVTTYIRDNLGKIPRPVESLDINAWISDERTTVWTWTQKKSVCVYDELQIALPFKNERSLLIYSRVVSKHNCQTHSTLLNTFFCNS